MKPAQLFAGWRTHDLTEGKIHKITEKDGTIRFAVLFPKTWEPAGEKGKTPTIGGTEMAVQFYNITSWEERELYLADPK